MVVPTMCRGANNFANKFEIQSVEIVRKCQRNSIDVEIGHPSKTSQMSKKLEHASNIRNTTNRSHGGQYWKIIKQSDYSQGATFFDIVYICGSKKRRSHALLAECAKGMRLTSATPVCTGAHEYRSSKNPSKYVSGMENLLYLGAGNKTNSDWSSIGAARDVC